MNKLVGIGLIGAGAYGLIQLLRMKNVSDSISTKLVNPRVHKVSLSGMTFRTEVSINNPTRDSITVTKPVVTLTTNGKPKNLWVLVLVLMKKENEGIALDANVHLFIVHPVLFEQME
jgi:hypothetical protein